MNKQLARASFALALLALPLAFSSCSKDSPRPKTAVDERNNKGHEDPTSAEFVLRSGILKPGVTFSETTTYEDVDFTDSQEQKITFHQDPAHLHSHDHAAGHDHSHGDAHADEDTFEVESVGKTPGRVYALEITYKNAAGEPMNSQLISADQLNRHQHFFRQVLTRDDKDNYKYVERNAPHLLLYKYAYCDVFEGQKNPVGFRGLIYFDKPTDSKEAEAQVNIFLAHFYDTKFVAQQGRGVLPYYTSSFNGGAEDFNAHVFFRINEAHSH